jgi:hypothetical protein
MIDLVSRYGPVVGEPSTSAITDVSVASESDCQIQNYRNIVQNHYYDRPLYKYLPAVAYPERMSSGYGSRLEGMWNQALQTRGSEPLERIVGLMFRHGLVVSLTLGDAEAKEVSQRVGKPVSPGTYLFYVGSLPPNPQEYDKVNVAQGGFLFRAKPFGRTLGNALLSKSFTFLPLWPSSMTCYPYHDVFTCYVNPEIFPSDPTANYLRLASIYNLYYSLYLALLLLKGVRIPLVIKSPQERNYYAERALTTSLQFYSNAELTTPTPSLSATYLNQAMGLALNEKVLAGPATPDSFNVINFEEMVTTTLFGLDRPLAMIQFNDALIGAPIYAVQASGGCSRPMLYGFVDGVQVVLNPGKVQSPEETAYFRARFGVPPGSNQEFISPGLAFFNVKLPPSDWSMMGLASWAQSIGISLDIFFKVIALTAFFYAVVQEIRAIAGDECADKVAEEWEPVWDDLSKSPQTVAKELLSGAFKNVCPTWGGSGPRHVYMMY